VLDQATVPTTTPDATLPHSRPSWRAGPVRRPLPHWASAPSARSG
jgi:hypothetical protein